MIDGLKPYGAYKDSGVPWLGEVPERWDTRKLRNVLRRVTERNRPDLPLLSVVREKGVILRDVTDKDENHNFIPDDLSNYKVVRTGQFAMNKMKAWQGSYGVSEYDGIVSPAYFVFDIAGVKEEYFHVAIRSRAYVPSFTQASDGVRIGQWDLAEPKMREITFLVPPIDEQDAVVRFLDYANRRIRRYIRAKQKLIKLLEEQKQVIIHRAATRGLDPNVSLKPSGIESLGDVPADWGVQRLGRIAKVFNGTTPSRMEPAYWSGGTIPWLSSGKVNDWVVEVPSELVTDRALRECSISIVPKGAVIIGLVGQGKTRGKSAILGIDACINQNLAAIIPDRELDGTFLHYFLTALYVTLREFGRGGNQEALNCEIVANWRVPVPLKREQHEISAYLGAALRDAVNAEHRIRREISLVSEFRTSLIADVVTGKLNVREAAAKAPGDELLDEMEELSQDEAAAEDLEPEAADAA